MKNLLLLHLLFICVSCKAQTPIFDIEDLDNISQDIYGAYYKDINNQLNLYEGTYLYANGNTSLKIVFQKKIMASMNGYYYEDLIIGGYQYIKNGIEIINTVPELNMNYTNGAKYSINGRHILLGTILGCDDCATNEKRLSIGLVDESTHNFGNLIIRRINVDDQPAIKIAIRWIGPKSYQEGTPVPAQPSIPGGAYTLIKQP